MQLRTRSRPTAGKGRLSAVSVNEHWATG
jgi:hypothetical protein